MLRIGQLAQKRDDALSAVAVLGRQVDFVATLGAMLVRPELAADRMQCRALNIAMAITEYFRKCVHFLRKRVVFYYGTIGIEPNDRSRVIVEFLCTGPVAPIPQRDIESPLQVEHQSRAEVSPGA